MTRDPRAFVVHLVLAVGCAARYSVQVVFKEGAETIIVVFYGIEN